MALYDEPQKTGNRLLGQNLVLQFDPNTSNWKYQYQPFNYTSMPTMPTFKTEPEFPVAPPTDDTTPETPTTDPCPPGYIYDAEKKMCVVDPNYVPPAFAGDSGGQSTAQTTTQSTYEKSKEAVESFFELKNEGKIDFNTYNPKTNLVKYNTDDSWENTALGVVAGAIHPILGIPFAIQKADNFLDEQELTGAGMLVTNDEGEQFIDLRAVHDVMKTKVMNPGVPEGNVLAETPGYYGVDDVSNYYKNYLENMNIAKEDMKIFGSTDVNKMFEEMMKSENQFKGTGLNFGDLSISAGNYYYQGKKLDTSQVNDLLYNRKITDPNQLINEISQNTDKYLPPEPKPEEDEGTGDGGPVIDTGEPELPTAGTGESGPPGYNYGVGSGGVPKTGTGASGPPGRNYSTGSSSTPRKGTGASGPPGRNYSSTVRSGVGSSGPPGRNY